jgi:hypothetical protein
MRFIVAIMLIFLFHSEALATNYCDSAVACWLFTDSDYSGGSGTTVDDLSPNSNTGSFKGAGEPAWNTTNINFSTAGSLDNSVDFDGSNDVINAGSAASIDNVCNSGCTVIAFINIDSAGGGSAGRIFDKSNISGGWIFGTNATNTVFFQTQSNGPVPQSWKVCADNTLTAGAWTMLAATYTSSTKVSNIYVNGSECSSYKTNQTGTLTPGDDSSNTLYIGNRSDSLRGFDGKMTGVAIFNRVLNISEINDIKNNGFYQLSTNDIVFGNAIVGDLTIK